MLHPPVEKITPHDDRLWLIVGKSRKVQSYASGESWSSGNVSQDHYNDQSSWSEPYDQVGTSSSGTTVDHVWGSSTNTWGSSDWWSSQGSGSGSGGGSSTGGSNSGGYDLYVAYSGFYQDAGYDAGWRWGVGWPGAGRNGPLGPSAFSGVGYVFAPGDPVSVADVSDQSGTEGQTVSLQVQASDWSGAAMTYSAAGLPTGLSINTTSGLITGTIEFGAAATGVFGVTVTATDANGNSDSRVFLWSVGDPVSVASVSDQSGAEGAAVSLAMSGTDANGSPLTWTETGLPPGLAIDPYTGVISAAPSAGDADTGSFDVTVTATDAGGSSDSNTITWSVIDPVAITDPGTQSNAEGDVVNLPMGGVDANGSLLTWSVAGLPPGLGIDPDSGVISGTVAAGDAAQGPYQVTVTATDGAGSSESQTFCWDIAAADYGGTAGADSAFASLAGPDAVPLWTELESSAQDDGAYMASASEAISYGDSAPDAASSGGGGPANPMPPAPPVNGDGNGPLLGYITTLPSSPAPPTADESSSTIQVYMGQRDYYYQHQAAWQQTAEGHVADNAAQAAAVKLLVDAAEADRKTGLARLKMWLDDQYPDVPEYETLPITSEIAGDQVVTVPTGLSHKDYNAKPRDARYARDLEQRIADAQDPVNFRTSAKGNVYPLTPLGKQIREKQFAELRRMDEIAKMSAAEKLTEAFNQAVTKALTTDALKQKIGTQITDLLSPTNIGIMAAMVGGGAIAQGTPLAPLVDAIGYAMFGSLIFQVGEEVTNFVVSAVEATTDADFQQAANSLLDAVATVAVQGGALLLAHGLKARAVEVTDVPEFAEFTSGDAAPKVDQAKFTENFEDVFGKEGKPLPEEGQKALDQGAKWEGGVPLGPELDQQYCFTAGTPLLTPEGERRIEEFRPGDLILSRSEHDANGPVEAKRVRNVFLRTALVMELHAGGRVIRVTPQHPVYKAGHGWAAAGRLRPGDWLVSHEGRAVLVERVTEAREGATVYNLEVEDFHTYFVGTSAWGFSVWAHNAADYTITQQGDKWVVVDAKGDVKYTSPEADPTAAETDAQNKAAEFNKAKAEAKQKLADWKKARDAAWRQTELENAVNEAIKAGKLDDLSAADKAWLQADPRRAELAYDPAEKDFRPNEARAALQAEADGTVRGPLTRSFEPSGKSPKGLGDDFVDASGKAWDVKDADEGVQKILAAAAPKNNGQPGENIIVDASKLSGPQRAVFQADIIAGLKNQLGSAEVIIVPKP